VRTIAAGDLVALEKEMPIAKARFGVPLDATVQSCYEAGRDGFWLHRWLIGRGVENVVVESSSIEVNRRARRAKTDRLDVGKLLALLLRWLGGERKVWSVVHVPSAEAEAQRQLTREIETVREDRKRVRNRIQGVLARSRCWCPGCPSPRRSPGSGDTPARSLRRGWQRGGAARRPVGPDGPRPGDHGAGGRAVLKFSGGETGLVADPPSLVYIVSRPDAAARAAPTGGRGDLPMRKTILVLCVAILAGAGCGRRTQEPPAAAYEPGALDQGWSQSTSDRFWYTSQGSQIVPYDYFMALELPDSQEPFASKAHFERLRYIAPPGPSARNPDALPIGFVKNQQQVDGHDILGVTCAACHTARWNINGAEVIVDGGPSKADFQTFFLSLMASMSQTLDDPDKYARFAQRVGGDAAAIRPGLTKWRDRLMARNARNPVPGDNMPGYGRDDAFNKLVNEITAGDLGIPENRGPATAAASFPHVWDAPQHDVLQWNGAIPNAGPGPALRNIGEVLGVYGTIAIEPQRNARWQRYPKTSAEVKNLNDLERDLWDLQSPRWPEKLLPIDRAAAEAGQPIFQQQCGSCHLPIERANPARRIVAQLKDVGTDPELNKGASRRVKTGRLEGIRKVGAGNDTFQAEDSALDVMLHVVLGAWLAHWRDFPPVPVLANDIQRTGRMPTLLRLVEDLESDLKQPVAVLHMAVDGVKQRITAHGKPQLPHQYKARPLNGIWATGPFLHNGSVPTLTELLKQDTERVKQFYVGSWALDPVNVGITFDAPKEDGVDLFLYDTSRGGNSNAGHNFGTELSPEQKKQLIEYIKTL
jgi:mono/diheme cytochrome c family protein